MHRPAEAHVDKRRYPRTYAVTLVREASPGPIHDPTLHLWPDLPVYPGLSRVQMVVLFDNWKWWEGDRWLVAPPAGYSSLARFTTAPLPSTSASDGHRIWTYDPARHTITLYPYDPAGTWPASEGFLKQFTQQGTLAGILESRFHCAPARYLGRSRIAGRSAYRIEFGADQCRRPRARQFSNLLNGRVLFWVDTETFYTLRADQYAFGDDRRMLTSTRVISIRYDVPLDQALFKPSVPPGYRLIHGR